MSEERGAAAVLPLRWRQSVRYRLLVIALLPVMIILPVLLALAAFWWSGQFDRLLISKAASDLTIARQYFGHLVERSSEQLRALADSTAFEQAAASRDQARIEAFLAERKIVLGLDFLQLAANDGAVLAAAPPGAADDAARRPVAAQALRGKTSTVIDVFSATDLQRLSPELAKRARLDLVPTEAAGPDERREETRGMVVHSATPVQLPGGRRGVLTGGILLNQNLRFIDTINDLVYQGATLPGGTTGTATLFLGDVRITTNVRLFGDVRALGTRASSAVRQAVLGEGRVWLDRAFVVNDWYISAYEPVTDSRGERIGMLYVGFLEQPFRRARQLMFAAIGGVFGIVALAAVPLFLRWAGGIFRPLERMAETIASVEDGDLSARTGPVAGANEISRVASHLDAMLDQLQERDRELRLWAGELDGRVAERTCELEAANKRLEAAQQQLVMSEKLAAIGQITAGVAHEINNPIAVIQGNLDVAQEVLGAAGAPVKTEFALISQQVHRINLIVTKLLQFARPDEFAGYVAQVEPAGVVTDCLVLVQHLMNRGNITVTREDKASVPVPVNHGELQQVLINLFVNAIHAMPHGGLLSVCTGDHVRDGIPGVAIIVADNGTGIQPDHLPKVFDAFFTTKRGSGTGLGLPVSYTIVARYGGCIWAESAPGEGSVFTVWLPAKEPEEGGLAR
jgi:two-component system, NtrC family, sensor kinase